MADFDVAALLVKPPKTLVLTFDMGRKAVILTEPATLKDLENIRDITKILDNSVTNTDKEWELEMVSPRPINAYQPEKPRRF